MSEPTDMEPMEFTFDDNFENLSDLNRSAWHALLGMSATWERDVIALLRSDEPIHSWVRSALADAIAKENPTGVQLKMSGHKSLRDEVAGIDARVKWVTIGEWIDGTIKTRKTRKVATEMASKHFGLSFEGCDKALDYSRRYRKWRAGLPADHPFLAILSEAGIAKMFHSCEDSFPLDGPDGLERAAEMVRDFL